MIATLPTSTAHQAGHYCPVCLRRVRAAQAGRRAHREICSSGDIEVSLVLCPTCGLTLAADVAPWGYGDAAASISAPA